MSIRTSTLSLAFGLTLLAGGCDSEPRDGHRIIYDRLVDAGAEPGAHADEALALMVEVGYDDLASLEEPMTREDQEALAADIAEAAAAAAAAADEDDQHVHRAGVGATVIGDSGNVHHECGDPITFFVATVGARIMAQTDAKRDCGGLRAVVREGRFIYDFGGCSVRYRGEYDCR